MKLLKIFIFHITSLLFFSSVFSAGFVVEVNPNNFDVNESVDVTIRAIRPNGETIVDYDGVVLLELEAAPTYSISFGEYSLPSDGIVFFEAGDLGQKTFSKAFVVRRQGVYTLRAVDINDESMVGQRDIRVGEAVSSDVQSIQILTPSQGGIETMGVLNILANASGFPSSPYRVILNNQIVQEARTDAQGSISTILTGLQQGSNALQIRILDVGDVVVAQSDIIRFDYTAPTDEFFRGIEVLPFTGLVQGDSVSFVVNVVDQVSSVELLIGNNISVPMDRAGIDRFVKQVLMEDEGEFSVSLRLNIQGNNRLYQDVAVLNVAENTRIDTLRFYVEGIDRNTIQMEWNVLGNANSFLVRYGTDPDNLSNQLTVNTTGISIENINFDNTYYFQVFALNQQNQTIGVPSNIVEVDPSSLTESVSCIVDGIKLNVEEIEGSHFFVWDAIENVQRYIIYRSDNLTDRISQMTKVGEVNVPRFEYPFDPDALNEEFAYYAVIAVCSNGQEILVDDVKKVQVGPYDNVLLVLILSVLLYYSWKIYKETSI